MKIGMFLQLETPSPRKTPWEELNFFCLISRKPTDSSFHLQDTPPNFVEILLAFLSEKTKQLFCTGVSLEGPSIFEDDNDIQVYIPRTQMTLVLVRKGLVLRGWPSKIEVSWVLGVYIFTYRYHRHESPKHICILPTNVVVFQALPSFGQALFHHCGGPDAPKAERGVERGTDCNYLEDHPSY